MSTPQRNKPGSDAAADSISSDSLSFAGFVSIQDQDKQHSDDQSQVSKQDPDFEFSTVKSASNSFAASPFKITPADMLISDGQIKPHAIAFQPHRSNFFTNPPLSLRSLIEIEVEHFSSKMASGETSSARKYNEKLVKARNLKNKETSVAKTWFGHKMLRSFVSPCRKCEAVQPGAVKGQTVQRERYKMH